MRHSWILSIGALLLIVAAAIALPAFADTGIPTLNDCAELAEYQTTLPIYAVEARTGMLGNCLDLARYQATLPVYETGAPTRADLASFFQIRDCAELAEYQATLPNYLTQ